MIEDFLIPVHITENKQARRFSVRVDVRRQALRVTVPLLTPRRRIVDFLSCHKDWLVKKIAEMPPSHYPEPNKPILFQGLAHLISHQPEKRGITRASYSEKDPLIIVHGNRSYLSRRIADFFKKEAEKKIRILVKKHTQNIGIPARDIRLKDTSSRWGSCTASGELSFSWRIIMAPPEVMDYIVAHEVAHLQEMNHGKRFHALCMKLCPYTDSSRKWLRCNGGAIQAVRFDVNCP